MERVVHYHHPRTENFSLRYCSASETEIRERQANMDDDTKLVGYPFDTPVYVLYGTDTEI